MADCFGSNVVRLDEGLDPIQHRPRPARGHFWSDAFRTNVVQAERQRNQSTADLGGVAEAPVTGIEMPADLDVRWAVPDRAQQCAANNLARIAQLDGPHPVVGVLVTPLCSPLEHLQHFFERCDGPRRCRGSPTSYLRPAIDREARFDVGCSPVSDNKPGGPEVLHGWSIAQRQTRQARPVNQQGSLAAKGRE